MPKKNHFLISDDEKDLWLRSLKDVKKLDNKIPKRNIKLSLKYINITVKPSILKLPPIVNNDFKHDINHIDFSTLRKINRGQVIIEASLDLHGFTLLEAFDKLSNFIESCFINKKRLVLVITGKGKESQNNVTIKNSFPSWLEYPLIKDKVVNFNLANQKHGGQGAYYIYLRKNKNDIA